MFELLEMIQAKQEDHTIILEQILQRQRILEEDNEEMELPQLPCMALVHLKSLEELLSESEGARKKLVSS